MDDDDDHVTELFDLLPLTFHPLHNDLRAHDSRWDYLDLLLESLFDDEED